MECTGTVKNGIVVLPDGANLPDGTRVRILTEDNVAALPALGEVFEGLSGRAAGLPSDLAENHDHYLHGTARRSE